MAADGCDTKVAVADGELDSAEAAARLLLDAFVDRTATEGKLRLKFGLKLLGGIEPNIELESKDADRDLREGRNLAALKRILEVDHQRRRAVNRQFLVLGIDEADKAPLAISRLVRSVWTHCQQVGVTDVRFAIAGVSPLHQEMVATDRGVERAFNRVLTLAPMTTDEARELLWSKFTAVITEVQKKGGNLAVEPDVIDRIASLSGGHPHIVQLLGSHMIQHENRSPDGLISIGDLLGALQRICYEDRRATYAATLHMIQNAGKLDSLTTLLGPGLVEEGFPTRIYRQAAAEVVPVGDIQWFVEHDILIPHSGEEYGLVDEFLRVRLAFDAEGPTLRAEMEAELVREGRLFSYDEMQDFYQKLDDEEDT